LGKPAADEATQSAMGDNSILSQRGCRSMELPQAVGT
jgi:hypothetical protein